MIYSLTGKVILTGNDLCVIECGGVGYACKTTLTTIEEVAAKDTATLYTYLAVREDSIDLFGFAGEDELETFKLLTSVSGVGSKFALAILSSMTADRVALAIASQDTSAFTKIKGVGNKIAQRIVMELKDKISNDYSYIGDRSGVNISAVSKAGASNNVSDAISALVVLGYSQSDAAAAVSKLEPELSAEELIREALRSLSTGRF